MNKLYAELLCLCHSSLECKKFYFSQVGPIRNESQKYHLGATRDTVPEDDRDGSSVLDTIMCFLV